MQLIMPNGQVLALDRPRIMGVLNVTPDSFSDGGCYDDVSSAVQQAATMLRDGADIIDVGGESTRPGASRIDVDEQIARTRPVIEAIMADLRTPAGNKPIISIDTTRRAVAEAALNAGASIINDVSAGREDHGLLSFAADRRCPIILMHMQGEPATMQANPTYENVVTEVRDFLLERATVAESHGITRSQIILDPGIGFGKSTEHNLQLMAHLNRFVQTGYPVSLGASRKRFIGEITGIKDAAQRDAGTAAVTALGVTAGVHIIRVHNVQMNRQAADVAWVVWDLHHEGR